MYVLAADAPTPEQWPSADTPRSLKHGKVPTSAGILWCADCGVARQNDGNKRAPIQQCNKCSVIYCSTQCAKRHFPSHVCISDQAEATARARDRVEQVTQDAADRLEQEMVTAEASDPRVVAEHAEQACLQPALRTIDLLEGEERKRIATLAMQTLSTTPRQKLKRRTPAMVVFSQTLPCYGEESFGSLLP